MLSSTEYRSLRHNASDRIGVLPAMIAIAVCMAGAALCLTLR